MLYAILDRKKKLAHSAVHYLTTQKILLAAMYVGLNIWLTAGAIRTAQNLSFMF